MLDSLIKNIKLGYVIFVRDFQIRYKRTYLGYVWFLVRPLMLFIPILTIGKAFKLGDNNESGVSYEAYSLTGILLVQFFTDQANTLFRIMRKVRQVLRQFWLPPISIIFASCFYSLLNLFFSVILVIIALPSFGERIALTSLLSLLAVPIIMMGGICISSVTAPLSLVIFDIRYTMTLITPLIMGSAPVVYVMPEEGILHIINKWNPLTYLINAPRSLIFGQLAPTDIYFIPSACFFIILFMVCMKFYHRTMRLITDYI